MIDLLGIIGISNIHIILGNHVIDREGYTNLSLAFEFQYPGHIYHHHRLSCSCHCTQN